MTASAVRQPPRSLRALTASLLAGTSLLTAPVTVIHIGATAAIAGASLWLGATPALAQSKGGTGGDSGYGTAGGSGGPGYGAPGTDGTTAAVVGGGGGGGGGPGAVGGAGGGAGGAGGSFGPIGSAGGNGGTGAGGGGGGGGATGATTFSNTAISGGAGGAGGLGGSTAAVGEAGGGGGGGGAGGYGIFYGGGAASIVTGTSFAAGGGAGGAGGNGGGSGAGMNGANGGAGGGGGLGLNLCGCVGSFTNNGNIFGGAGGTGGSGGVAGAGARGGNGGQGGDGGWGVISYTATFINNGTITGGNGGNGGAGGTGSTAGTTGTSGNGGFGFYGGNTIVNHGTISGGVGGSGATRSGYGMAIVNATLTNTGTIAGGNASGASGTAGIGINALAYGGQTTRITNSGAISGGSGGVGGGAAAIVGNRMHIVNSGTITGGGGAAIFFTGGNNSLELQPGYVVTGTVSNFGGGGTNTLKFGGSSGSATFDLSNIAIGAQYQDFSVFSVTGATWTFTGTATQTDPWTISGGTALVNGDLSSVSSLTVNGGTLGGTGAVGNVTVNSGGTFAPGTPGTANTSMTVNGNLTFASGSTYAVTLSPSSSTGATVTGTATLAGTVAATYQSGGYLDHTYRILTAANRTGTFSTLNNSNLPFGFAAALAYNGSNVDLVLTLTGLSNGTGLAGNPQNVFNAINTAFSNGSPLPPGFVTLAGSGNPNNAYGQAAGEPGASITQAGLNAAGQFINSIFESAMGGSGAVGGAIGFAQADDEASAYASKKAVSPEARAAYAAVTPRDRARAAPSFGPRWGAWASVYGGNNRVSGNAAAGTNTTTSDVYGVVAGADYRVTPSLQLGFALGGAGSRFDVGNGFGGGRSDIFNAALYGKYTFGPAYLAGAVAYAWQDSRTDRTVTVAGFDVLHASFHANALTSRLEAGWRYASPLVAVTPYAALQSTTFYLPSYGETATTGSNQFALTYGGRDVTATRGELGARFDKAMPVNGGVLTWKGKLAWAHDWNTDRSAIATFQTLPAATFTVNGAQPSANAALVSLGVAMNWHKGWSVSATFDGEFSRTTTAYAGKGTLRYVW